MADKSSGLDRYAAILDDHAAFIEACARPLPRIIWANLARLSPEIAESLVLERCPEALRVPWHAAAWRLPASALPGRWDIYQLGLVHAQEEAALWVVAVLDPQPGERVLDMCASPGNKTVQIAQAMDNSGYLIANERAVSRLAALRHNLTRFGICNVVVTNHDGASFPRVDTPFDRILVDAPCSCEGTTRKGDKRSPEITASFRAALVRKQKGLLGRAIKLVRPGGVVVYSTCTFAPEENEEVVSSISAELASLEAFDAPSGFVLAPGIPAWQDRAFRADIDKSRRLWPHHNDTGGFYVAKFRKNETAAV